MLRSLRKYSNSTPVKILYGLLAALFVVWGVGAVGGEHVDVVAKVHGRPITRGAVSQAATQLREQYERMLQGKAAGDLFRNLDLEGQALDQLIDDALLQEEARRLGVAVSDEDVLDAVTKIPDFQEHGRFDPDRVRRYLEYRRDRGEFEAEIRRSLLFQRLEGLVADGVQVSDGEVEERYRHDHERAVVAFARVSAAEIARSVTLSDEELEKYLADHPDPYRVPAKVRVRYVAYRPADFAKDVQPTDGEVAEQYALSKDEKYAEPEEVHARHILVQVEPGASDDAKAAARKKADDLLAQLKAGADFPALAKKSSDDPGSAAQGGDLGFFPRGRMTPAFEEAAFALAPGQLSDVVESPFGFHLIRVEEHREARTKPLEAVRDEIVARLKAERGAKLAREAAEEDLKKIARGGAFAEVLANRHIQETPPFAEKDDVPGVGRLAAFADAAFALRTGQVSDLVESDGPEPTIYLLVPFERTEAHVPPLAEVRDRVLADARRARAEETARQRGEALLGRAKEIGLDRAAAEAGVKVEETGPFERRGALPSKLADVPAARTDAFTLDAAAPLAPKVYTAGGDAVVVALRERLPADTTKLAAEKDKLRDSLLQQKRHAVSAAYLGFLKERALREGALEVRPDAARRG
ncbi:MAG TPA: SurA N-terminal domain-containing protein [Candidatus Binatia bacterium]|nr:SurA N-terminal domain-containing protein [Candidatus Binatia bacterium]